jgi:cell division protein FtsB
MKVSHLAVSFVVSVCVYLTGTLLFGQFNQAAYDSLEAGVVRVERNLVALQHTSEMLYGRVEMLRRSRDTVQVAARDLQLYAPGESVVRVSGFGARENSISPGAVIRFQSDRPDNRPVIRAAAVVAFFVTLLLSVVSQPSEPQRRRNMTSRQTEILRASR